MKNDFITEKLKKGETICFGRYPQKSDPSAAPEPIEWIILETDEKSVKLLSRYGLTAKAFDDNGGWGVTWENCTLRSWLNGYGSLSNVSAADYSDPKYNFLDNLNMIYHNVRHKMFY